MSDAYARAGVDIDAGNLAVQRYRDVTSGWTHPDQLGSLGGFSGLFRLPGDAKRALVGSTDGVGTKILIASALRRYETVGALAEDVRRYLASEPVLAGPPATLYRPTGAPIRTPRFVWTKALQSRL